MKNRCVLAGKSEIISELQQLWESYDVMRALEPPYFGWKSERLPRAPRKGDISWRIPDKTYLRRMNPETEVQAHLGGLTGELDDALLAIYYFIKNIEKMMLKAH